MPTCTAHSKRTGEPCRNPALTGSNLCRMHGGASSGRPIKHGRYSIVKAKSLAAKVEEYLGDERPGDLTGELALMRGLLQGFLDTVGDDDTAKPETIKQVYDMVEGIAKLVEKISRILNDTALTQAEVELLHARIADAVLKFVPERDRLGFLRSIGAG